jgi:hypothetical protein
MAAAIEANGALPAKKIRDFGHQIDLVTSRLLTSSPRNRQPLSNVAGQSLLSGSLRQQ